MPESPTSEADRARLAHAIGSLIWKDPKRILDNVAQLRGTGAVIECNLRGGSMGTAIPAGSAIRIRLEAARPYRVGEIVAFVVHDGLCVHRIAYLGAGARAGKFLITQGDACLNPDSPIELRYILGPASEFKFGESWIPPGERSPRSRAGSFLGRSLLSLVAWLLEIDVRAATLAVKILRLRKESTGVVSG